MRRSYLAGAVLSLCAAGFCLGQQPVEAEMTVTDLRAYMDALHIGEADERGVRAGMKSQRSQWPPWWPQDVFDEMITVMLKVDLPAIEYPFVKPCLSSPDMQAMTHFWTTPEGDAYGRKITGGIVAKEANGTTALEAHNQEVQEDSGLPMSALDHLPAEEQKQLRRIIAGPALDCLGNGFQKASAEVDAERNRVVRTLIQQHRPQIMAAKEKYEAAQGGASPK
jgi:hypothetical protein